MSKWTANDVAKIIANPYYCLRTVHTCMCEDHEPIVSEEAWIKAASNAIKQKGSEKFLKLLLQNLKGEFLT